MYDTSEGNKTNRWSAQATLWVTLEAGLRLLHPMMPFVTEELWQRLPGRGTLGDNEPESIMLAQYPKFVEELVDTEAERLISETMKIVKACRSLRASYNVPNKTLTHFFVKTSADGASDARKQIDDIKTLGKASNVEVNAPEDSIPQAVGTIIVDDQLTIFMDVKGLIDFNLEIERLNKSLNTTVPQIEGLQKKIGAAGYEENVPADVKRTNKDKLESLQKKKSDLLEAIANFEKLAILDRN